MKAKCVFIFLENINTSNRNDAFEWFLLPGGDRGLLGISLNESCSKSPGGASHLFTHHRNSEKARNITRTAVCSQVLWSHARSEECIPQPSVFQKIRDEDSCGALGFIPPKEGICRQYSFHVIVNEEKPVHHFD